MTAYRSRWMYRLSLSAAMTAALLTLLPGVQSRASAQVRATRLVAGSSTTTPVLSVSTPPSLPAGEQARVMGGVRDAWADFLKRHSDFGGEGTPHDLVAYNVSIEKQEEVYRVTLSPKQAITREVDTETGTQIESETTVIYFDISRKNFTSTRMRARHVSETSPSFGTSPALQAPPI